MRGRVDAQKEIFHAFNLHELIPASHPLRQIEKRADAVLAGVSRETTPSATSRPSSTLIRSVWPTPWYMLWPWPAPQKLIQAL